MKPVAWMRRLGGRIIRLSPEPVWDTDEPLYTAPRELNEVEILELWTKKNRLDGAQGIIDFARAIIKKASER